MFASHGIDADQNGGVASRHRPRDKTSVFDPKRRLRLRANVPRNDDFPKPIALGR
jgi:hypothetical protein